MFDPSDDMLCVEVKEERGERVTLESATLYAYGWGGPMRSEKDGGSKGVEVTDEGDEVRWEAEESEGTGKEAMVMGWEGSLEVYVVYICICFGAVCVFDDELEEHGGSCAGASFSEAFSRWAEDFV